MKSITLYKKTATGAIQIWRIGVLLDRHALQINYGQLNGKLQEQIEVVSINKSGRSISEQIKSRALSRISKQRAKGYRNTIEEANKYENQNELNLFKPMLAQQFNKQKSVNTDGAILQRKLDGNRMLVTKQNGKLLAYTRNGKPIETLDHIMEQMDWLKENQTVDGEVYVHGMDLKDINSRIKRRQEGTLDLNYHIYDYIEGRSFKDRFNDDHFVPSSKHLNIYMEPYWYYKSEDLTKQLFNRVRQQGYEGLMMRLDNQGYQPGKRSKGLLKIKFRYDAEYPVIDIERSDKGTVVLTMRLPNGKTVNGVAPGTVGEKSHVLDNPDFYIGKLCTCSFAYLTEYGIPFHLTCDSWRDL